MTARKARERRKQLEAEITAAAKAGAEAAHEIAAAEAAEQAAQTDLHAALAGEARGQDGAGERVAELRATVAQEQARARAARQSNAAALTGQQQASHDLKAFLVEQMPVFAGDASALCDKADQARENAVRALQAALEIDGQARQAWSHLTVALRNKAIAGLDLGPEPQRVLEDALRAAVQAPRPEPPKAAEAQKPGLLGRAWRTYKRRRDGETLRVLSGSPGESVLTSENNDDTWDLIEGEPHESSEPTPESVVEVF